MSVNRWIDDDEHPAGSRVRTEASGVRRMPRKLRAAELVCRATAQRPALTAVVGPKAAVAAARVVTVDGASYQLGVDFQTACRCGADHAVDGGLLRAAVLAADASSKPARIDIAGVSRS